MLDSNPRQSDGKKNEAAATRDENLTGQTADESGQATLPKVEYLPEMEPDTNADGSITYKFSCGDGFVKRLTVKPGK